VDPKTEYKREGFGLFTRLFEAIEDEVTSLILRIRLAGEEGTSESATGGSLEAKGMGPGTELDAEAMAQRQAAAQGRRPVQRRALPASQAFDAMRQRQAHVARTQQAQQAQQEEEHGEQPRSEEGQPAASEESPALTAEHGSVGRNDPCPCGSGKKFKKCHGRAEA